MWTFKIIDNLSRNILDTSINAQTVPFRMKSIISFTAIASTAKSYIFN